MRMADVVEWAACWSASPTQQMGRVQLHSWIHSISATVFLFSLVFLFGAGPNPSYLAVWSLRTPSRTLLRAREPVLAARKRVVYFQNQAYNATCVWIQHLMCACCHVSGEYVQLMFLIPSPRYIIYLAPTIKFQCKSYSSSRNIIFAKIQQGCTFDNMCYAASRSCPRSIFPEILSEIQRCSKVLISEEIPGNRREIRQVLCVSPLTKPRNKESEERNMQDFAIPFTKVRSQPTPLCRNQNVKSYKVLQLARAWDPAKAVKLRLPSCVDELAHILPISSWNLIHALSKSCQLTWHWPQMPPLTGQT